MNETEAVPYLRAVVPVMRELGVIEFNGLRLGEAPVVLGPLAEETEEKPKDEKPKVKADGFTEEEQRLHYGFVTQT